MKTVQECIDNMQYAWEEYYHAIGLTDNVQAPTVQRAIHAIWLAHQQLEEAQMPDDLAMARAALRDMRPELASLKDENLTLSEVISTVSAHVQELRSVNKKLNAELALETTRANEFAAEAGILAQRVKEYEAGHTEVRGIFAEVRPPAAARGIKGLVSWAVEEITTLREVNAKRETAHVPAPEVVAAINSVADLEAELTALTLPNDKLDIAILRLAAKHLPAEYIDTRAAAILRAVAVPREKRVNDKQVGGSVWCDLVRRLQGIPFGLTPAEAARQATPEHQRQVQIVKVGFEDKKTAG
ncbi:MAG: hypothetical protein WC455_19045 [Dehalococcoidia bacterium]|jgi:hypothetical protein